MDHHLPREGPWFLIYLRPEWRLVAAPYSKQAAGIGHLDLWEDSAVRLLATHYGIRQSTDRMRMANAIYGFPRGRVCRTGDSIAIHHGQDWPTNPNLIRSLIVRRFGLEAVPDLLWFYDQQLRSDPLHRSALYCLGLLP